MREAVRSILSESMAQHPAVSLLALQSEAARPGLESAHAPLAVALADVWLRVRHRFYPHLVRLCHALERHETVLLDGWASARHDAAVIGLLHVLHANPTGRALIVVADVRAALAFYGILKGWTDQLDAGSAPTVCMLADDETRDDGTQIIIATAASLHATVLARHDDAWRGLWQHLSVLMLWELHEAQGIGLAHLRWLLRRAERIRLYHRAPRVVVMLTSTPATNSAAVAAAVSGRDVTVIPVDDVPIGPCVVATVAAGAEQASFVTTFAARATAAGYRVHVACEPQTVQCVFPAGLGDATCDNRLPTADIVVCAGAPNRWLPRAAHASGAAAVIVVDAGGIADAVAAVAPRADTPWWAYTADNVYVDTLHIHAAAAEIPILPREQAQWQLEELAARLVAKSCLRAVDGTAYVPGEHAPELEFDLQHAVGAAALLTNPSEPIAATHYERWYLPGMTVPPWHGGAVVTSHDREQGTASISAAAVAAATIPVAQTTVRLVHGAGDAQSGCGRVAVTQTINGVLRWRPDGAAPESTEVPVAAQLPSTWYAPAWWWHIGTLPAADVPWAGWSICFALSAQTDAAHLALVPCYDAVTGCLAIVEAEPGGAGFIEPGDDRALRQALRAAQEWVLRGQHDPWLAPFATVDARWIGALGVPDTQPESPPVPDAAIAPPAANPAIADPAGDDLLEPPAQAAVAPAGTESSALRETTAGTDGFLMQQLLEAPHARPTRASLATLWQGARGWWQSLQRKNDDTGFVLGDAVRVLPYGDGVVVGVDDAGAQPVLIVATQQYGEVRVDPARDLIERR